MGTWLAAGVALAVTAALAVGAALALAAPRVTLKTRFQPDKPGQSTTIHWGFRVSRAQPLRSLQLSLPAGMGLASTSLGLESCTQQLLEGAGPRGCPADSRLGHGTAVASVPAESTVTERAAVTAVLGPPQGSRMTVLFFVDGRWPLNRQITLQAALTEAPPPYGPTLLTEVPPLAVWPDGPNIRLIRFRSTIGPQGITYYRRAGGRRIAFTPRGLTVPSTCPRGGFPVAATFTWWGVQGTTRVRTRVPCPRAARRALSSGASPPG